MARTCPTVCCKIDLSFCLGDVRPRALWFAPAYVNAELILPLTLSTCPVLLLLSLAPGERSSQNLLVEMEHDKQQASWLPARAVWATAFSKSTSLLEWHGGAIADLRMLKLRHAAQDFYRNFKNDPKVKIPWVRRDLSGPRVLVMEWVDGLRCTDPESIRQSGLDVNEFIRGGVRTGLRMLLEVGTCRLASHLVWHGA